MGEQFRFPFENLSTDTPLSSEESRAQYENALRNMSREELEAEYMQEIGFRRYSNLNDDQIRIAVLDPEKETSRLGEEDREEDRDVWKNTNPPIMSGK